MIRDITWRVLNEGVEFTKNFIHTYGLSALVALSITRGLMLFWIAPDETVTISYVLFYADNIPEVAGIVFVSSVAILLGNSVVYLLFHWLGEKLVSESTKTSKTWRFLNWAFDRNGKFSILLFRMTPLIGGDWVAMFSGITDMDFRDFLLYSFVAILLYEALIGFGTYYGIKMGMLYELDIPVVEGLLKEFEMLIN
ncbi:MAG: DedA family protein [Candidatus Aenigmatarchaeota archaeon]